MRTLATTIIAILITTFSYAQTCTAINECANVSVESEAINTNQVLYRFIVDIPADCYKNQAVSHVSFELPTGVIANSPVDNSIYTSAYSGIAYDVENGTNNPFYSIKFNVNGSEGFKRGETDVFEFIMPATADMSNTQVEVKIATNSFFLDMGISNSCRIGNLPVELSSFEGKELKSSTLLTWTTETEMDNYGFEIEASKDAENWTTIGFENGMGNSDQTTNYQFEDTRILNGTTYYRLKQINYNETFDYSEIIAIKTAKKSLDVQAFPNPTTSSFTSSFNNPNALNASVQLANAQGQMIYQTSFDQRAPTSWSQTFDNLDANVYILILRIGTQVETQKIVVAK